jgi:hypothetical protein
MLAPEEETTESGEDTLSQIPTESSDQNDADNTNLGSDTINTFAPSAKPKSSWGFGWFGG